MAVSARYEMPDWFAEQCDTHIELTVRLAGETPKAVLVNAGSADVWLPRSRIEFHAHENGTWMLRLSKHMAKEKGLIP